MCQKKCNECQSCQVEGKLLDIESAAERLNISSHTVRALVRQRKITFVKLGAWVLFRSQDLDDFIKARLIQAEEAVQEDKI